MRQPIRINRVGTQMLEHLPHHAFSGGNIPCDADYIFIRPTTHGFTSADLT